MATASRGTGSLGFLTESTLLPRRARPIAVDGASMEPLRRLLDASTLRASKADRADALEASVRRGKRPRADATAPLDLRSVRSRPTPSGSTGCDRDANESSTASSDASRAAAPGSIEWERKMRDKAQRYDAMLAAGPGATAKSSSDDSSLVDVDAKRRFAQFMPPTRPSTLLSTSSSSSASASSSSASASSRTARDRPAAADPAATMSESLRRRQEEQRVFAEAMRDVYSASWATPGSGSGRHHHAAE